MPVKKDADVKLKVVYVMLRKGDVVRTIHLNEQVNIDKDKNDNIIGVECLFAIGVKSEEV